MLSQPSDIVRKIRLLEIRSRQLADQLFSGEYHSAFRGRGMRYREIRAYEPGDDIRFIDWNVSARYGQPYTKVFEEERELQLLLMIDISASMQTGSGEKTKTDLSAELAATLGFSAAQNQDLVGAVFFHQQPSIIIKPAKGTNQVLYMLHHLFRSSIKKDENSFGYRVAEQHMKPQQESFTDYVAAFRSLHRLSKRKAICFLISDFTGNGLEQALRSAAKQHDLIGIHLYDRLDQQLPEAGLLTVRDPETGKTMTLDTNDGFVRYEYEQSFLRHHQTIKRLFRAAGAELLSIRTDQEYTGILQRFFLNRIR